MNSSSAKRYDAVDLAKLLLSVAVCAIHSLSDLEWIRPYCSLAVPLFFVFSGFFFFRKWKKAPSFRKTYLPFFCRTGILYLAWFVIWLPPMVKYSDWLPGAFQEGIVKGCAFLAGRIVLAGTFPASWYLSALVVGVFLICVVGKMVKTKWIVMIGALIYIPCVFMSNYRGLFSDDGIWQKIFVYTYPGTFYHSFPAGIFFLSVGKYLAETERIVIGRGKRLIGSAAFLALLYGEYLLIRRLGCRVDSDCYFMLMAAVPLLAVTLLSSDRQFRHALAFRNLSTINYCMHGGLINLITLFLAQKGIGSGMPLWDPARFFGAEILCFSVGMLLICLSKKKGFAFLKYLY